MAAFKPFITAVNPADANLNPLENAIDFCNAALILINVFLFLSKDRTN